MLHFLYRLLQFLYMFLWSSVYTPIQQGIFALPAFYIFSAAYKSFKLRNIESSLFLITGAFVMLMNMPYGQALWSGFGDIGNWLLDVPMTGMMRAMTITAGIGVCAFSIRTLLIGRDK